MCSYFKSCCLSTKSLHHHHRMHIENESAEIVTTGEHEFKEIVKEEILVEEGVPELPLTDSADTAPAQGKPRCITSIFHIHRIYICVCCAFMLQEFYGNHMHIYIYPMSPTSVGSSSCYT